MGSKSKSTQSAQYSQADNRSVVDASGGGFYNTGTTSSTSTTTTTVNMVDSKSVAASLALADKTTSTTQAGAFLLANNSATMAYKSMSDALGAVTKAYSEAKGSTDQVQGIAIAALVVVGIIGFGAWRR